VRGNSRIENLQKGLHAGVLTAAVASRDRGTALLVEELEWLNVADRSIWLPTRESIAASLTTIVRSPTRT